MKGISIDYGNYIKAHRTKMGLTQSEVAKRLGISQQAYSRYELGEREPGFDFIIEIAKILDYDPGEFFNERRRE